MRVQQGIAQREQPRDPLVAVEEKAAAGVVAEAATTLSQLSHPLADVDSRAVPL